MNRKNLNKLFLLTHVLLLAVITRPVLAGEITEHTLSVNGTKRHYTMYTPDEVTTPAALVMVLHGGLGNAEYTQRYGMNDIAERESFVVVYPEGSTIGRFGLLTRNRLVWNAGECCGRAARDNIDDVAFIGDMLDQLITRNLADPDRIFITGMSNGGMMTYRLVCELPHTIAAAAPVAGTLTLPSCAGGTNTPVLHIHGMDDSNVPLEGGTGEGLAKVEYRSIDETMSLLTENRSCDAPAVQTDSNGTRHIRYICHDGADVSALLLPGVEHTWPGMSFRNNEGGTLKAQEVIWEFFSMQ